MLLRHARLPFRHSPTASMVLPSECLTARPITRRCSSSATRHSDSSTGSRLTLLRRIGHPDLGNYELNRIRSVLRWCKLKDLPDGVRRLLGRALVGACVVTSLVPVASSLAGCAESVERVELGAPAETPLSVPSIAPSNCRRWGCSLRPHYRSIAARLPTVNADRHLFLQPLARARSHIASQERRLRGHQRHERFGPDHYYPLARCRCSCRRRRRATQHDRTRYDVDR